MLWFPIVFRLVMNTQIELKEPVQNIKNFLSLKWKAFIVISMVIIIVNGSYYIFHYLNLSKEYTKQRIEIQEQNIVMLNSVFEKSDKQLQNMANLIPELNGIKDFIDNIGEIAKEGNSFQQFDSLQIPYDINAVAFYDKNANLIEIPIRENSINFSNSLLIGMVKQVNATFQPGGVVICDSLCVQASVVPYLSKESQVSSIVVFSSIADSLLDFSKLSNKDIAVIGELRDEDEIRSLPMWSKNIEALTHFNRLINYVFKLSSDHVFNELESSPIEYSFEGVTYENSILPLGLITKSEDIHLLIIDDVTEELAEMAVVARESLNIAILALLSSELALLFLLWNPLSRLRFMSTIFPLLAEGKYKQVRDNIARNISEGDRFVDEIDLVNHAAYKLSHQLEALNNDVTHYTHSLAENMEKLGAERDFTNFLLQTAQVIIVTTNRRGQIVQSNMYATNLLKNGGGKLEGRTFLETFVTVSEHKGFKISVRNICNQKLKNYRNESSFYAHDGHLRNIAWVHSYLGEASGDEPIMLSIGTDITERKEAEKRISWLANHDPLTGLYNRRYFNEMFENALQQNMRYKRTGALLYLDLDNFKFVNDTLGHQVGDKLIKEVALALKRITRASDIISRIGGDEFAIVIQDIDEPGVTEFCEDLNRRINAVIRPLVVKQKVSTSIGIAMFPHHGKTVNQLLVNADIAMYQAKGDGKGGWHLFSEKEQAREKIQHHETWKDRIEHAIEHDRFILYFQPIMNITNRRITHYEVLVRMLDGDGGIQAPLPFISVAENSGLIHKIDMIVVEKTIAEMNILRRRGINVKLSINLSAFTFSDRKILPTIRKMLNASNINNSNIIFEITETAALQDIGAACDLIEDLQKIGVGFAIDDFGVGFSSFYYLRELPVDYIKIDGSFIQELARSPDDQLIVKAMSEVAKGFGKKTIAEYVEDEASLDILRKYKVDFAQGFHIGEPAKTIKAAEELALAE